MEILLGFASLVGCVACFGIVAFGLLKGKE